MAKEIKAKLKLQIPGGGATPAPPVGSALGQYGVNIMDFVQAFNNDTSSRHGVSEQWIYGNEIGKKKYLMQPKPRQSVFL